ncbi:MAG: hypothetical protein ABI254_16345 [Chthoniobacterales bacterium]
MRNASPSVIKQAVAALSTKLPRHMRQKIKVTDTACICDKLAIRGSRILERESIAHTLIIAKGLRETRLLKNGCAYHPENSSKEAMSEFLKDMKHTVIVIDDTVLDFTIRQFIPDAEYPHVAKVDKFRRQWRKIVEIRPSRKLRKVVDSTWENLSN